MRLRSTAAAALLASVALVLPTAGQSLADDRNYGLGEIHYRYADDDGDVRRRSIEPGNYDTCYRLTGTSRNSPAFFVENETDGLALVYRGDSCGGEAQEVLRPGERARDLNVRSVEVKPSGGHHGRHDRDDWDDDDRSMAPGALMNRVLRSIG
ncbi:hypothetical protein ACIPW5_29135 [Streptomyces sp. NPDC090077]|uniref:hypothetical protein n=1 Tax=Streptomyces sp. NPDC090077 TaxID=3365938 RepID=UPI0037F4D456